MHYLFGIICFILLITSPLPAPDNEQCLEPCPRSQSLPRATQTTARQPLGCFTSPGKHPALPKAAHCLADTTSHIPSDGQHLAPLPHMPRELLKPAPVHQALTCSQKKPVPCSGFSCPEPFLHFEPSLLHGLSAEQGNHYEFLPNSHQCPNLGPTKKLSLQGQTAP